MMGVSKKKLQEMIDHLPKEYWDSAYDYICYLLHRDNQRLSWEDIDRLAPDNEPLNEEEKHQLEATEEYIAFEKAVDEYKV